MSAALLGKLVVVGVVWSVGYLAFCRVSPYRTCGGCEKGRVYTNKAHTTWHLHRWCDGKGDVVRFGARLMGRKLP